MIQKYYCENAEKMSWVRSGGPEVEGGGGGGGGLVAEYQPRIEVIVKMKSWGRDGYEPRIEVIVKMQNK